VRQCRVKVSWWPARIPSSSKSVIPTSRPVGNDFIIVLVLVVVPVLEGYGGTRNVLRLLINSKKYAPSSFNCSCKKAPSRGRGRRRVRERYRTALRLASPPSAEQIDRSAQLQQRIIRWLNPVYSRNRIKDDFFLFRGVIFDRRGENHLAQPG
jgi:hypothetical protein